MLGLEVPTPDWAFMNYGYAAAPADVGMSPLRSCDERDRLCVQLYLHAIDHSDLRDRDVLEVGSGRGGGASYISRYLQPRSMTGMDFSQQAVDLCNRHRLAPGLAFVCGDAQSMPFPASSSQSWQRAIRTRLIGHEPKSGQRKRSPYRRLIRALHALRAIAREGCVLSRPRDKLGPFPRCGGRSTRM